jgi:hypothetical protein
MILDSILEEFPEASSNNSPSEADLQPFIAQAGGFGLAIGWPPYVSIVPLRPYVEDHDMDVYFRNLTNEIDHNELCSYVYSTCGKPFEHTLGGFVEMFLAVKGSNKANNLDNVFCSEYVGELLMHLGLLSGSTIVSNVIPERLSAHAGMYDVAASFADPIDRPLKLREVTIERKISTSSSGCAC